MSVIALIRAKYNTLSASQKHVADYIFECADSVMLSPLAALAAACGVSEPTIMRFLHKIGYDSYQIFRVDIAQELAAGKSENFYPDITEDDNVSVIRDKVLGLTARSLLDSAAVIDPEQLERLVDKILSARQVFVIGIGASAALAFDLQHKLLRFGINVSYSHDAHIINIVCSNLGKESLLIAFTHSGESREILSGIKLAKENGAYVTVICSYDQSGAVKAADCSIISFSVETQFRSDSLTSRIIQFAIIDMIYVSIVIKADQTMKTNVDRTRIAVAKNKT